MNVTRTYEQLIEAQLHGNAISDWQFLKAAHAFVTAGNTLTETLAVLGKLIEAMGGKRVKVGPAHLARYIEATKLQ